jgi:hypothetical protein
MTTKFDELTKAMAQSVTRRAALKRLGISLAGMALACFGLADVARADKVKTIPCATQADCPSGQVCCNGVCVAGIPDWCDLTANPCCCYCVVPKKHSGAEPGMTTALPPCDNNYTYCRYYCGSSLGCP